MGRPGPGAPKPSLRKAARVFRIRHYRHLWFSSTASFTGMQMQQVARALLAWELTHSYGAVGAISLSFGLPMMLFSLIGGSLADRLEKRNLTLMTQGSTGILALLTAILVATNVITIEMLFVIGLVQGTFFAFGMPARTPLMAEVAGPENIMSAIAMSNASMNATRLVGPAFAGVLIALWGIDAAYFAQAGFYVVSSAILLTVPTGLSQVARAGMPPMPARGNMFVEIGRGLRYAATDPRLRLLFGMLFIVTFFAMPYIMLLAGFIDEDLGLSSGWFGAIQAITGAGGLVGSLGIATLTDSDRKPLIQWIAGIGGGVGLVMLAVGSGPFGFAGAAVAVFIIGVMFTAYQTINNTMVMAESDPAFYGRVMSINMLTFSVMPMMALPLGAMADHIGARETFMAQGAIVLVCMALVAVVNGRYTFGRHDEPQHFQQSPEGAIPMAGSGAPAGAPGGGR
ncbi:MAG: MFS transporter [Dehalococcoidia bacterium]|nr:MFS transporter [Dehalococcoidia bacterium]MCA9844325.1 MFS transporter [Dehalococcoidia bacterium]